jgi:hypothetical protein
MWERSKEARAFIKRLSQTLQVTFAGDSGSEFIANYGLSDGSTIAMH